MYTEKNIRYEDYKSLKQWIRSRVSNIYTKLEISEYTFEKNIPIHKDLEKLVIDLHKDCKEIYLGRVSGAFYRKNGTKALRTMIDYGSNHSICVSFGEKRITEDLTKEIKTTLKEIEILIPEPLEGDLDLEIKFILVKENGSK